MDRAQGARRKAQGGRLLLAGLVACVVAACGTAPRKDAGGKYYADDGPPAKVPEALAQVPDADFKDEPFHKFANRPYTVFGKTYVPVVDKQPTKERGLASWYGRKFHGQRTASGETYDMFAMTAAHKTLPIPSYARVTNLQNGQSVVVRINDRGPFHGNRVIDLSYAAAERIGIVARGSGMVEVERLVSGREAEPAVAPAPPENATVETALVSREASGLWLQLGAFSSAESAESFRDHVQRELSSWSTEPLEIAARDGLYRVRLGPYRNPEEATAIGDKVRRSIGVAPLVTPR